MGDVRQVVPKKRRVTKWRPWSDLPRELLEFIRKFNLLIKTVFARFVEDGDQCIMSNVLNNFRVS
ncbi:hypothetical protein FRX31_025904 [Thalictrum thalictroides]|uniref:Uncharacterized protein n=1 Tax=Thalictrum thalictroides TaxID=46969 RepID=A0A7J6VHE1_THATH|nr:hypothetical protein FRX31_025904 [Thalictrum thalictroides]